MIVLSVKPDIIPVNEVADVTLRLKNTGNGTCTNIHLTLEFPREIFIVRGNPKIKIVSLAKGQYIDLKIRLRAKKEGVFNLTSTNFSYRSPSGQSQRISKVSVKLHAKASTTDMLVVPTLELNVEKKNLFAREWNSLSGSITNNSSASAQEVTVSIDSHSLRYHKEVVGDGTLFPGKSVPFTLSVFPTEVGSRVPITLQVSYKDKSGKIHWCKWPTHFCIDNNINNSQGNYRNMNAQIKILFLGANPVETLRLQLGKEVEKIQTNLKLAKERDNLELKQEWAVTTDSLMQSILDESPDIIHFSGHGEQKGIILENEMGAVFL
ncbi:MAG: hypothetical protein GY804_06995 [Alphaproteobacteria bacterium]|nr:hypothetical protein [Alphaproteobacteria bacterium]